MNHIDILNKYITVVEAKYRYGNYSDFSFSCIGDLLIEFNHPQFYVRGEKQVKVHIYLSRSDSEIELIVIADDDPFEYHPFKTFMKYCGISENDIDSWVTQKYLETLRNQRVDVSSISFSV